MVATINGNDSGIDTVSTADEFGVLNNPSQAGVDRYAWLGGDQRASDNPAGIILMGVRLYNPTTGWFLSADPVAGGSCNAYEYACGDPINNLDLTGTAIRERRTSVCTRYDCIWIRRICNDAGHCSIIWDLTFRKGRRDAAIYAGWKWAIIIGGWRVAGGSYTHEELGGYNLHGSWFSNNASHGRGWYKCWGIFTCRFRPTDSIVFEASGEACLPYQGAVAWTAGMVQVPGGDWSARS